MKKLLVVALLFMEFGFAQKQNNIYGSTSLELGNYFGMDVNMCLVKNSKFSFVVGYLTHLHNPEDYPDDIDDSDDLPLAGFDDARHFYLSAGKVVMLGKSNVNRLNMLIGIARTKGSRKYDYIKLEESERGGYFYDHEYEEYTNFSLIINPKIEFAFTEFLGLFITSKLILNNKRNYYGMGLGMMLGKLR